MRILHDFPQEVYPSEAYYHAAPVTIRLSSPARDYIAGALLVFGGALLGWYARSVLAMSYDYTLLAWLVPIVTFLIAWGNRHDRT